MNRALSRARRFARKLRRAAIAELRAWASRGAVRPQSVLYESFAGNGALCNPEAIFRGLLRDPDFAGLRHIWVLDGRRGSTRIPSEFRGIRRVRFVRRGTAAYFHALATSGYLVNNATFPPEFSKRTGQTYLNTWHGTPLKLMGYDMPDGSLESANTMKNFLAADWLLSQNPFMTEQMYARAYRLRGAFRGRVLETGYPRVDRQFLDDDQSNAARENLESAGVHTGTKTIVLFAPTWKGDSFSDPRDDAAELAGQVAELQELLGEDFSVLLKTHQSVHTFARTLPGLAGILVPNDVPTNVILGVTTFLITDYSSIFFDHLASNRPVIFFTPDAADYTTTRGTYFAPDALPGPVFSRLASVATAIRSHSDGDQDLTASPRYRAWQQRFSALDDGHATERVIDAVFRGRPDNARTVSLRDDSKKSLLLFLGGMRSNGITSSALNLLRAIDHEHVDVSIIIDRPMGDQQRLNQALIDPRVRQFHRIGGMNGNKAPHLRRRRSQRKGKGDDHRDHASQARLWDDEWNRCFGDARFDAVADFSGYSAFWATLMLHSPRAIRSIWLHNDMAAEEHRVIRGRTRMARGLRAVFALYSQFDRLVSVSPSLSEVNRESLAREYGIDAACFTFARNLVDGSRVSEGVGQDLTSLEGHPIDEHDGTVVVPDWAEQLRDHAAANWFVSVGRFSTEKNQARLIRAFSLVHESHPSARLVVIGYGPLRVELEELVAERQLSGAVFIVGPYQNPFPIMAAADCFVLSSDYEGQPMVLLEAALIGLPIVSVAFRSVGDALDEGEILVVEQDDLALAEGMLAFLNGVVTPAALDVASYTRRAMSEFVNAVLPVRILGSDRSDSGSHQQKELSR
ncbi:MAG: glycosyltransferase [Microbacteriaceae bacterium]|nr:glycosyltransferase [Microbacteriaceae bacterium]